VNLSLRPDVSRLQVCSSVKPSFDFYLDPRAAELAAGRKNNAA